MDITRNREADTLIKSATGDALRQLRQAHGLTLSQAAEKMGKDAVTLSAIEDGEKTINLPHWFQLVATLGGTVSVEDGKGFKATIDRVPPVTDEQIAARRGQQEKSRRAEESRRWLEDTFTPSSQKTDIPTPPVKKRRPRIVPPQSKN